LDRFVIISGCSGGTTLLEELRRRGHQVVAEPGRRIVAEEIDLAGSALPWIDAPAFARRGRMPTVPTPNQRPAWCF
jgi:predicted ATPase